MNLNFFSALNKAKLPDVNELTKIPATLKTSWHNTELNVINVRFFNNNFTKMIPTTGIINRDLAIPIIYIETPHKAGIILMDDTSYFNVTTKEMCIDVCESYPFALDKKIDLKFDWDAQYYNDITNGLIDKENAEKLRKETGKGYYLPVFLNNIPIPIIKHEKNITVPFLDNAQIKSITYITQALLMQLSRSKLFARTTEDDKSGMGYAFLLGFMLGGLIFSLLSIYLLVG